MKPNQPKKCERCDAPLDVNGDVCYQRNCNYTKKTSFVEDVAEGLVDFTINEAKSGEGSITQQMKDNREMLSDSKKFMSENSGIGKLIKTDGNNDSDDGETIAEELGSGCLFGFFKIIWNIISFPFKIIIRILSIFD